MNLNFRNRSAGASATINTGVTRLTTYGNPIPYLAPWAAWISAGILAAAGRLGLHHDEWAWLWALLTAVVYAVLAVAARLTSRARGPIASWLATAATAMAGVWSWCFMAWPHVSWRWIVLFFLLMFATCVPSMMFVAWREGSPQAGMQDKVRAALDKIRNMNDMHVVDGQLRGTIELEPGETIEDARNVLVPVLASMHDLPATGAQITQRRGASVRVGDFRLSPDDRLAHSIPFGGPSIKPREGGTLLQPLRLGLRRASPLNLYLPGDAKRSRNAAHTQVTGMNGAGKSILFRIMLIEALTRGDFEYWYLNARKAAQEPEWVRRGAARIETTVDGIIAAMTDIDAESPSRSEFLGRKGFEQWAPGCGMKLRLILADEAAAWATDGEDQLVNVAETTRSLGEVLALGFQRATGDRFPTSARSQFPAKICLGLERERDAEMGLPEDVLDAGASPWVWKNFEPGRCYAAVPGTPEAEWPEDARIFGPSEYINKWGEWLVEWREAGRPGLILPSVAAPQPAGSALRGATFEGDADIEHASGGGVALATRTDDDDLPDDEESVREGMRTLRHLHAEDGPPDRDLERPKIPPDMLDEFLATEPDDPIETDDSGGWQMRRKDRPKMSPTESRTFARSYLLRLREAGESGFKLEDVGEEILYQTGNKGSWLDKIMSEFIRDEPRWLRRDEDRGWYSFVQPRALPAGDAT